MKPPATATIRRTPSDADLSRKEKWAEYRRRLQALYSVCWDCPRPCAECQLWARETAFGRVPSEDYADACAETYAAAMEMQRLGTWFLMRVS